jgi:hypothetical protein
MGVPGWPEPAAWTASIASVRMVFTDSSSSAARWSGVGMSRSLSTLPTYGWPHLLESGTCLVGDRSRPRRGERLAMSLMP